MGTTLNRHAYQRMIDEDLEWLAKQPRTLEREHIEAIVRQSPDREYGPTPPPTITGAEADAPKLMTADEWKLLSAESRFWINEYIAEFDRLQAIILKHQAAGEVEAALAELREMLPGEEIGVELLVRRGNALGNNNRAEILLIHAEQSFTGSTLPEAMQRVHEWKANQKLE